MVGIEPDHLEHYLRETLGRSIKPKGVGETSALDKQAMEELSYGKSLKVTYERDGQGEHVVFCGLESIFCRRPLLISVVHHTDIFPE